MKRIIISICLLACFILQTNAKDTESDKFLSELAVAINQNSSETGIEAKYNKKCFYIISQEDYSIPSNAYLTEDQIFTSLEVFLNDDDVFKTLVFGIDNDHPGFLKNMYNAKAKLQWTYNVPNLNFSKTVMFKKDDVALMFTTPTAQRKKLSEQVTVKNMNCMFPLPVDEGVTLQNMKLTSQSLIWNFRVDEDVKRLEDLAKDDSNITGGVLFTFCKDKESDFTKMLIESGLNIKVMITGMPSRRYFDTEIPASLIKEVATNEHIKDALSVGVLLGSEKLKKNLPIRLNEQRTMTKVWFSYDNMTEHMVIEEAKNGVEQLNLLTGQPDLQRWLIASGLLKDSEDIKNVADAGISYEYIVKGEGLKDSLSIKIDNAFIKQVVKFTQWERDSIEVALNVALSDAQLKIQPKTGEVYLNSIKVEGANVVKEYMIAKSSTYNTIKRYPMTLRRGEFEEAGRQSGLFNLLRKCKRNLVLRYVNKQNAKLSFDVFIGYHEIE